MRGRAWRADDTATLRRLVAAGMTDVEIGREASVICCRHQMNSSDPGLWRPMRLQYQSAALGESI